MDGKTKVAGPLAAAGAVSLGLVFIGACGIGQEDTYVPPPPIRSGPQAVEQAGYGDPTATTVARVSIPPSPTWRMAPEPPPKRTLPPEYRISVTPSTSGPTESDEMSTTDETTRRTTSSSTETPDEDSAASSSPDTEMEPAHSESPIVPTTVTRVLAPRPTTTVDASDSAATPDESEPPSATTTPNDDSGSPTEPTDTDSTTSATELGETTPFERPSGTTVLELPSETTALELPSETTGLETSTPLPTITLEQTVPGARR